MALRAKRFSCGTAQQPDLIVALQAIRMDIALSALYCPLTASSVSFVPLLLPLC
jgi:hypothetical protein